MVILLMDLYIVICYKLLVDPSIMLSQWQYYWWANNIKHIWLYRSMDQYTVIWLYCWWTYILTIYGYIGNGPIYCYMVILLMELYIVI